VLVAVAILAFLVINWILGAAIGSWQNSRYKVTLSDEKVVYGTTFRNIKEDFALLLRSQPSRLNGEPIRQADSRGQAMAVVIENYTPIRGQQDGLEEAAIVYEALAEGGITRFLAIYDGGPVEHIGPVRSARPYFISYASEYRAPFVHVGGSAAALGNLRNNFRVLNIDEFSDAQTVWRDKRYTAPHNAFTSTTAILKRLEKSKYYVPMMEDRFQFKDTDPDSGDIHLIKIDFSITPYAVKYEYDPSDHRYTRFNGGTEHHQIKPSNIVVQFVDTKILDSEGRLFVQTHGAGKALVFRDGKVIEGTWQKDASINSKNQAASESWTKFFDKNGKEIELNKGQVWIEVVPNDRSVNYF
jgi:hypothetical protein